MKDCPDCQKCDCKIHVEIIKIKTSGKQSPNRVDIDARTLLGAFVKNGIHYSKADVKIGIP